MIRKSCPDSHCDSNILIAHFNRISSFCLEIHQTTNKQTIKSLSFYDFGIGNKSFNCGWKFMWKSYKQDTSSLYMTLIAQVNSLFAYQCLNHLLKYNLICVKFLSILFHFQSDENDYLYTILIRMEALEMAVRERWWAT